MILVALTLTLEILDLIHLIYSTISLNIENMEVLATLDLVVLMMMMMMIFSKMHFPQSIINLDLDLMMKISILEEISVVDLVKVKVLKKLLKL